MIYGKAGTGKSTIIKKLDNLFDKQIIITSTTGCSADLINGITIHNLIKKNQIDYQIKYIIIDEISMIDDNTFNNVL